MNNILRFDQFKEGYVFEQKTLYRENIESLNYLQNRYKTENINEGISDWWNDTSEWFSEVADNYVKDLDWEDIAHTAADVAGVFGDIKPGLGATIDVLHALVYFYQAQGKEGDEKRQYMYNGLITLIFAHPFMNVFQLYLIGGGKKILAGILGRSAKAAAEKEVAKEAEEKVIQELLDKYSKDPGGLEWKITRKLTKHLPEVEKWLKKELDKLDASPGFIPSTGKFKKWALGLFEWVLKPLRWLRDVFFPRIGTRLTNKIGAERVAKIINSIPAKGLKWFTKNTIIRLLEIIISSLPKMPTQKKILMFDSIAKGLEKAQKDNIYNIFRKGEDFNMYTLSFENERFIFLNLNKGSQKCKVIVKKAENSLAEATDEIKEYYSRLYDQYLEKRTLNPSSYKPPQPTQNRTYYSSSNMGFRPDNSTPNEINPEELAKLAKEEWVNNMSNSSIIREIDKSEFLEKAYQTVENRIKKNALGSWSERSVPWKIVGGITKFFIAGFTKKDDSAIDEDIPDESIELSEEQVQEWQNQIDYDYNPDPDAHVKYLDTLSNKDQEQVATEAIKGITNDTISATPASGVSNIYEAVWKSLKTIYQDIEIPDQPQYVSPEGWLREFQRENNINPTGKINAQTLEKLNELSGANADVKDFITTYLSILPREPEVKDDTDRDQQQNPRKERGSKKRRTKSFDDFQSEEEKKN